MNQNISRRRFLQGSGAAALLTLAAPLPRELGKFGESGKPSGALRIGLGTDQDTLNPFTSVDAPELFCCVYDKLVNWSRDLTPELSLAKSRTASPNGKTITYTLRQGVKFHDGSPLTSADVKFSFDVVKKTGLGNGAAFVTNLLSTEAPDAHTFVTNYSEPPADDAGLYIFIVPKHLWQSIPTEKISSYPNNSMIGSGPFKFVNWTRGQSWSISRNSQYWGPQPGLETISWIVFQNEETLALALTEGEIDLTYPLSATIYFSLENAHNIDAARYEAIEFVHFGFNLWTSPKSKGNPLLRDQRLRQAMAHAIDKNKLVQLVLEGYGRPGTTIIMPAFADWHYNIPPSEQLTFDPQLARDMLDSAGYILKKGSSVRVSPSGKPLRFRLFASTVIPVLAPAAQLIVPMLEAVGIEMDLTVMSDPTLAKEVFTLADYDCFVWDWFSVPTPTFMLSVETKASIGTLSDTYYNNPAYDRIVALEEYETNFKKRQELVFEAQKIFYDSCAYIVLFYMDALEAHRTDTLTGWLNVPGGIVNNNTAAGLVNLRAK